MPDSIRVRILDRDYPLRVQEGNEELTREIAAYVDARMRSVRASLPDRPVLTVAVITALSLAEELFAQRNRSTTVDRAAVNAALDALSAQLDAVTKP